MKLLELVKNGEIDVAIVALPLPETGLMVQPVYDELFMVAVPRDHAWAKTMKGSRKKQGVASADLKTATASRPPRIAPAPVLQTTIST